MEAVTAAAGKHPYKGVAVGYGTAGFRTKADVLDPVLFRVGLLAALRSRSKGGATIGVMITASHNPACDNGAKLIDPMGEMLDQSWEACATELAQCADGLIPDVLQSIIAAKKVDMLQAAKVLVARDTRASGPALAAALRDGVVALGGELRDEGIMTTPICHYLTRCNNDASFGTATEAGYYEKTAAAFKELYEASGADATLRFKLDCANGVGAMSFKKLLPLLGSAVEAEVCNDGSTGELNHQCGADYVKTTQGFPTGVEVTEFDTVASFDGDADRLVFSFQHRDDFQLMDGDRIAILAAEFLQEKVMQAGLLDLNLGVVQTAYANGGSTKYLKKIGLEPACTKTGVKHLHHKAVEYDIGVYFEANGHGTVVFSDESLAKINAHTPIGGEEESALSEVKALTRLINQTVGDAISDLLLVEIILANGKSMRDWLAMYADLPNKMLKVKVADRAVVTTTNAERTCVTPAGLQAAIDELVASYPQGRSFVRPSGTEDVVRVYAEADTKENADELAYLVAGKVFDMASGVGDRPAVPRKRAKTE